MFSFVIQKILSKKWMILSLIIGNILLVGIVSANPIYSNAVLQDSLKVDLSNYLLEENKYVGNIRAGSAIFANKEESIEKLNYIENVMQNIDSEIATKSINNIAEYVIKGVNIDLENDDGDYQKVNFGFLSGIEEHSQMIDGQMFKDTFEDDGTIGVVISESMLMSTELLVGETYELDNLLDENDKPYKITVKGVFESSDINDSYWVTTPSNYTQEVFMSEKIFKELFVGQTAKVNLYVSLTSQIDFTTLETKNAENILTVIKDYEDYFEGLDASWFYANFSEILDSHLQKRDKLNVTLLVLQVPIFILLAAFIYMVSSQIIDLEQSEIAIFKSRGASKKQIMLIYIIQSGIISLISLAVGIIFGYLICQILGSSNAFLEFVNRSSLPAKIGIDAVVYAIAAALFSVITMVAPAFKHANVGIVVAKRKKQQWFNLQWWEKFGIDIICVAVSLYGLFTVENQKEFLIQKISQGENVDPIIFIYSSVFIIGIGLFALRLFPYIIKLIFFIGKNKWSPASYVSLKRVMGKNSSQGFIMVFLTLTISLGIFSSITARTINSNEEKEIRYEIGADVVLKEVWDDNADDVKADSLGLTPLIYQEPDYGKYSQINGVKSYAQVYRQDGYRIQTQNSKISNVSVMGIKTDDFGKTAWFDPDLLPHHWYEYLNAISQNPSAILMSSNAQKEGGLKVGDIVNYYNEQLDQNVSGTIYAFVDYWPTFNDITRSVISDGSISEVNHYLVVANLSYLQSKCGVAPYEVWFKTENSTQAINDFILDNNVKLTMFENADAQVIKQKSDAIFQGTNGILTVGFITVLLLCAVGFLIYWILSIMSRQLQFGIFRAMGMSMKEVLQMLINEQVCVSGYAVVVGVITGFIASNLYVPLIELTYASADQALPLEIVSYLSDNIKIFAIVAIMIIACMFVLFTMISKLKIAQALKLGED